MSTVTIDSQMGSTIVLQGRKPVVDPGQLLVDEGRQLGELRLDFRRLIIVARSSVGR
ncbi:hypothetical protein [Pseudonocardia nigra]|uniref:hypothetical protein n=1 Tax=Pseudonocardia nigra TaxID=1921578 RepID=UPI001C600B42|nr:hypothetical protein [Pseudonocardia nigra]